MTRLRLRSRSAVNVYCARVLRLDAPCQSCSEDYVSQVDSSLDTIFTLYLSLGLAFAGVIARHLQVCERCEKQREPKERGEENRTV